MSPHDSIQLRRLIAFNPSKSEARGISRDALVTFLPMEAVSEIGDLDVSSTKPLSDVYNGYTYFRSGDVVVAKITPCFENGKGALIPALTSGIGFGTTEFHVLRPSPRIIGRYLSYVTRSVPFRSLGAAEMKGAAGQQRVPEDFIKDFRIPLPSITIQQAIADYLDEKTADLDALIEKKRKLLDLLAEERAALINQAVTKGLDPSVPMKDSGIPWIGEIPAHWTACPLYARYTVQLGKMLDASRQTGQATAPYLRNADIQWGSINVENLPTMDFSPEDRRRFNLIKGDILTCEGGANASVVGKSAIWNDDLDECYYQKALHRIRPRNQNDEPRFLFYALWAAFSSGVFTVDASANIFHLTAEKLRVMRFPFPNRREQEEIALFLDDKLSDFTKVQRRIGDQIARLQEYRQALITAAVTGQLNIGAAA